MVWEQGSVVLVMLSRLSENGQPGSDGTHSGRLLADGVGTGQCCPCYALKAFRERSARVRWHTQWQTSGRWCGNRAVLSLLCSQGFPRTVTSLHIATGRRRDLSSTIYLRCT